MDKKLEAAARAYHALPQPGKIEVRPTKSHNTQQDLTLAYSPGMAVLCKDIEANPELAYDTRPRAISSPSSPTVPLS